MAYRVTLDDTRFPVHKTQKHTPTPLIAHAQMEQQVLKKNINDLNKTLQECQNFLGSIDRSEESRSVNLELDKIESRLDSSALNLNQLYLHTLLAQLQTSRKEQELNPLHERVEGKRIALNEVDRDSPDAIDRIKHLFNDNHEQPPSQSSQITCSDTLAKDYGLFVENLCAKKDLRTPAHNRASLKSLIDLYASQHDINVGGDDDDLNAGNAIVNPICPLTGKLVELPMRAACGHFFSTEGLNILFQGNRARVRCPWRGCTHDIAREKCYYDRLLELEARVWAKAQEHHAPADEPNLERI